MNFFVTITKENKCKGKEYLKGKENNLGKDLWEITMEISFPL